MNAFISKMLADQNKREALAWLKQTDGIFRNVGELGSNEESIALIEQVYAAGAKEVIAVKIDDYGADGQNTGHLVVELSADPDQRRGVLNWISKHAQSMGFDAVKDSGQQFEYVRLD